MIIIKSKNILKYLTCLGCELSKNLTGEYLLKMINELKTKQKFLYLKQEASTTRLLLPTDFFT